MKQRTWVKITENDGSISYEDWGNCFDPNDSPDCEYEIIDYPPPDELVKIIADKRDEITYKRLEIATLEMDINYYLTLIN